MSLVLAAMVGGPRDGVLTWVDDSRMVIHAGDSAQHQYERHLASVAETCGSPRFVFEWRWRNPDSPSGTSDE